MGLMVEEDRSSPRAAQVLSKCFACFLTPPTVFQFLFMTSIIVKIKFQ